MKTLQSHLQPQELAVPAVTLGIVVDTNDPQQMGRLRVMCPALNDRDDAPASDIPWASYVAPFGGDVQVGSRGPDNSDVTGPTAYGMWAIPKIGAQVLVMCLDGRTDHRVWIGCLFGQLLTHTLPHGRFTYDPNFIEDNDPGGPYDSYDGRIEPLASNMDEAFPNPGSNNYEYQTRAADFQAAGVDNEQIPSTFSELADDEDLSTNTPNSNLETSRQGYSLSRIDPELEVDQNITDANFDNMVTAIVSPGFHAISMDDRPENERMRLRTAAGHQVIFDDTNERIYINTAKGENWVEIDQAGNIDIYTSGKMSVNAEKDINFSTQGSFRVNAEKGIHLRSGMETRITSEEDISIDTEANIRARAQRSILLETSQTDISLKAASQIKAETTKGNISLQSGSGLLASSAASTSFDARGAFVVGGTTVDLGASSAITITGSTVNLNSGPARDTIAPVDATPAETSDRLAFYPNRRPEHEPWARGGNDDETGAPLLDYASSEVGIQDFATGDDGTSSEQVTFTRGELWRR